MYISHNKGIYAPVVFIPSKGGFIRIFNKITDLLGIR